MIKATKVKNTKALLKLNNHLQNKLYKNINYCRNSFKNIEIQYKKRFSFMNKRVINFKNRICQWRAN